MILQNLVDYLRNPSTVESELIEGMENAVAHARGEIELPSRTVHVDLPTGFLTGMIEVEDRRPEVSRLSEQSEYVHVSSLLDICPRQYAIARQNEIQLSNTPTSAQRIVWEIGKSLERHVIRQLKSYHGEQHVHTGYNFTNNEYMISGEPDILVNTDQDVYVITECKSMNARDFQTLERPIADHILQAALYQWLFNNNDTSTPFNLLTAHDHVILLYVAKDYIRGGVYKEFHIDTTQQTIRTGVEIALERAAELKQARENERIPRRYVCDRQDCSRSKNCPVSHICWSLPESGT